LTVCIAAISDIDGNPLITFAADRLVSTPTVQFESSQSKIQKLTDYAYVLIASNDSTKSNMIVRMVKPLLEEKKLKISDIADLLAKECRAIKDSRRQDDILGPYGLTYSSFREESGKLSETLQELIAHELTAYNYTFKNHFLVVGLDPEPHIFIVDQDGNSELHDYIGFAVIGAGRHLAFAEFTRFDFSPKLGGIEVLFRVYSAKKAAERTGGIGPNTDIRLLWLNQTESGGSVPATWEADGQVQKVMDEGIEKLRQEEIESSTEILQSVWKYFDNQEEVPTPEPTDKTEPTSQN